MKRAYIIILGLAVISGVLFAFNSSDSLAEESHSVNETASDFDLNSYWYSGKAELSSYKLKQARYGEVHEGTSVLVFVTEPFNYKKMVKSDSASDDDIPVLKLNNTRKFDTGIYPYSMMTSSFLPFEGGNHSLKISSSSQEWCGHTYMTLQTNIHSGMELYDLEISSYFENESTSSSISKSLLEDDIWSKIRLNPSALPQGEISIIPSFFFLRMRHTECKGYNCVAKLTSSGKESTYMLDYKDLNRSISITFETEGAHKILSWEEAYESGFGADSKTLKTEGTLIKTIQSDYWNKHKKSDSYLRTELGLE